LTGTVAIRVFEPKTRKWMVEFSARIVTAQDYVATSISELTSPGFATFALRGHYRVSQHLRLNLALENLFNQPYSEPGSLVILNSQGTPALVKEPGFSALMGLEAQF
jgi:outer membrane receptor protein involved in Fe transport